MRIPNIPPYLFQLTTFPWSRIIKSSYRVLLMIEQSKPAKITNWKWLIPPSPSMQSTRTTVSTRMVLTIHFFIPAGEDNHASIVCKEMWHVAGVLLYAFLIYPPNLLIYLLVLTIYSSPQPASQIQTPSQFSPPLSLPPSALSATRNDGNSGLHRSDVTWAPSPS